jgi:hypothetical protein
MAFVIAIAVLYKEMDIKLGKKMPIIITVILLIITILFIKNKNDIVES